MAKISELFVRQGSVEVEGTIKEIGEVRSFDKFGRQLKVADAILEDDSGSIKLTLWNDDISRFKQGDNVKVVNGFVNEFQGEPQLTSGKFGRIEKAGEGSSEPETKSSKKNKKTDEFEEPEEDEESDDIEEVEY